MYKRLQELGVPTSIVRDTDETLTRNERIKRMTDPFGNGTDVIIISNHINAGGGEGAEVVYALRNSDTLAKNILDGIGSEGQLMRKYYQRRLPENPMKDYYYIQRLTGDAETLLVEYGFIDNQADARKLQNNIEDYVEGALKAIVEYAGYEYKEPSSGDDNGDYYTVKRGDALFMGNNE